MPFDAVIFDLDGTLLDTLDDLADSMNAVLSGMGCAVHPVDAYRYFVGNGIVALARRALPAERRDEATVGGAVEALREHYAEHWADKTRPYEGIGEMLDGLVARGLPLSVFTNKPDDFAKRCVAQLLPRWEFAVVLGAREGVPVKPDPAGALEVAERMGVAPERFLYLGDTDTDMATARAAGMWPAGVLWGFRPREELAAAGAKALLERPVEILDLF